MQILHDEDDPRSPSLGSLQPRQDAMAQELADPKQYQTSEEQQTHELVQAYISGIQRVPGIRAWAETTGQGDRRSIEEIDGVRVAPGQLGMICDKLQRESP